jgi:hypothetical protein
MPLKAEQMVGPIPPAGVKDTDTSPPSNVTKLSEHTKYRYEVASKVGAGAMKETDRTRSERREVNTRTERVTQVEACQSTYLLGKVSEMIKLDRPDVQDPQGGNLLDNILASGTFKVDRGVFDRLTKQVPDEQGGRAHVEPDMDEIVKFVAENKELVDAMAKQDMMLLEAAMGMAYRLNPNGSGLEDEFVMNTRTNSRTGAPIRIEIPNPIPASVRARFGWGNRIQLFSMPTNVTTTESTPSGRNIRVADTGALTKFFGDRLLPYLSENSSTIAGRALNRWNWWKPRGTKFAVGAGVIGAGALAGSVGGPLGTAIGAAAGAAIDGGYAAYSKLFRAGVQLRPETSVAALQAIKDDPENGPAMKRYLKEVWHVDTDDFVVNGDQLEINNAPGRTIQTDVGFDVLRENLTGLMFTHFEYLNKELNIPWKDIQSSGTDYLSNGLGFGRQKQGDFNSVLVNRLFNANEGGIQSTPLLYYGNFEDETGRVLTNREVDQIYGKIGNQNVMTRFNYEMRNDRYVWDRTLNSGEGGFVIDRDPRNNDPILLNEPVANPFYDRREDRQDRVGNIRRLFEAQRQAVQIEWEKLLIREMHSGGAADRLEEALRYVNGNADVNAERHQKEVAKVQAELQKFKDRETIVSDGVESLDGYLSKADELALAEKRRDRLVKSVYDGTITTPVAGGVGSLAVRQSATIAEAIAAIDRVMNNAPVTVGTNIETPSIRIGNRNVASLADRVARYNKDSVDRFDGDKNTELKRRTGEQDKAYQIRVDALRAQIQRELDEQKKLIDADTTYLLDMRAALEGEKPVAGSEKSVNDVRTELEGTVANARVAVEGMTSAFRDLTGWGVTDVELRTLSVEDILARINTLHGSTPANGWTEDENNLPLRQKAVINAILEAKAQDVFGAPAGAFADLTVAGVNGHTYTEMDLLTRGAAEIADEIGDPAWTERKIQAVINERIRERRKVRSEYNKGLEIAGALVDARLQKMDKKTWEERQRVYQELYTVDRVDAMHTRLNERMFNRGDVFSYDTNDALQPSERNGLTYFSQEFSVSPTLGDPLEPGAVYMQEEQDADVSLGYIRALRLMFDYQGKTDSAERFRVVQEILPPEAFADQLVQFLRVPQRDVLTMSPDPRTRLQESMRFLEASIRRGDIDRAKYLDFLENRLMKGFLYNKVRSNVAA